jgi:hypothetical protein
MEGVGSLAGFPDEQSGRLIPAKSPQTAFCRNIGARPEFISGKRNAISGYANP